MSAHQTTEANTPRAFDVLGFCQRYGVGRSTAFKEMAAGRLKARKSGRRTIIMDEDAAAWAAALPEREIEPRKQAA